MIFFPDNRDLMPDLPVRQIYFLQKSFAEIFRSGCLIKERNTASVLNHIFDRVHISNGCNMLESFNPHSVFRQGVFQDPPGAGAPSEARLGDGRAASRERFETVKQGRKKYLQFPEICDNIF